MFGRTSAQRFTRVSFWIAIWLLLLLGSGTAQARPFEERLTEWLNEPGVRMVAVEFPSQYEGMPCGVSLSFASAARKWSKRGRVPEHRSNSVSTQSTIAINTILGMDWDPPLSPILQVFRALLQGVKFSEVVGFSIGSIRFEGARKAA